METETEEPSYQEYCHWVARRGGRGTTMSRGAIARPMATGWPRPSGSGNFATQRVPLPPPPPTQRRGQSQHQQQHASNRETVCMSCGRSHNRYQCPAYGRQCLKCNKFNHFARMCNGNVYEMCLEEQDAAADQVVYSFNKSFSDWSTVLKINECDIRFKLDTGADVNVLPLSYLNQIGISEKDLLTKTCKLTGYSGSNIKVVGSCNFKVQYRNKTYILEFIIADVTSPPILGRYTCEELNMVKLVLTLKETGTQNELRETILRQYADVFEGIGCMPGEHKIQVDSTVRPVVHAPRKLPVALKDDIKKKLDDMVLQGIIAKVEGPTDWVNSRYDSRKKSQW